MREKVLLFVFCLLVGASSALGQTINVKGTFVDENNEGLPGVSITLKSSPAKGAISDVDGKFSIQVKTGETLSFSFMGYTTRELAATPEMNVKLEPADCPGGLSVCRQGIRCADLRCGRTICKHQAEPGL